MSRLTPRYRRASLLGPQEGFKNGFQNEAKLTWEGLRDHFRVILAVLAALEGLLERLGLVLGSSWAVLKASRTVLEGSWELLGGLGSVLATSWEPSWRLWGAILGMSGPSWA